MSVPPDPSEKPYLLIPPLAVKRSPPVGHATLHPKRLSGTIEVRLTACTPLQVASGTLELHQGMITLAMSSVASRDRQGRVRSNPVLPGSSLKGALRTLVEIISPACFAVVGRVTRQHMPAHLKACSTTESLCPACQLFGMAGEQNQGYQGQVRCTDATVIKGNLIRVNTPRLWAPARGGMLPMRYRSKDGSVGGRKLYYPSRPAQGNEARMMLAANAELATTIHFINCSESDLGLLLAALGQHPDVPLLMRIGAAKPVGYGSVRVHLHALTLYDLVRTRGRLGGVPVLDAAALTAQCRQWCLAAEQAGMLNRANLNKMQHVLAEANLKRPSVEGAY